jgi:hypothetical protein
MSENRLPETRLREQQEIAARQAESCQISGNTVWKVVAGVALAVGAAVLLTSLNDIRRYVRIMRM